MASHVEGCQCPTVEVARKFGIPPKGSIRYMSEQEIAERFVAEIEEELL